MKHLLLMLFAVSSAALLYAQESVMINEPAGQCYLDLKSNLPEAVNWNDDQMMVTSRPLVTTLSGNVEVVARIFTEYGQDKKTHERMEMCRLVVAINAPEHGTAWNAMNSGWLFRNASLLKARIEAEMKGRRKKGH